MKKVKRALAIIAILTLLIGGSALFFTSTSPAAAEDGKSLQLAPLNSDFIEFTQRPYEPLYGHIPHSMDLSHLEGIPAQRKQALRTLPATFDWRDAGKVTPVRNQNPCGTCWIHGMLAAVESRVWIVEDIEYDFSEQNVACCTDPAWVYLVGNRCDGGGWSWLATDVLTKKGTRLESCDPYDTGTINTDTCDDACTAIKRIIGFRLVASDPSQITEVKNAVYDYGPVSMAYCHDNSYFNPGTNIYYWPDCTETTNHEVCIVGWDDAIEWPGTPTPGYGAWIVKNSWGTSFGDNGYFYLCYGSGNMEDVVSYRYVDYDANETVYYWDEAGYVGGAGYSDTSAWMASIFTSGQDGTLTHVDFWTTSSNATYDLYVYDGSFGSQLAFQTGSCVELGYYSIPLTTPVPMTTGQQFTVAVKMTTPGYNYPLPAEYEITGFCEPPIQSGVCFTRHLDADVWDDAVGFAGVGISVCLRARVATNTPPEVSSVTASQGSPIVNIAYDVSDAEQSEVSISFEFWDGADWQPCITTTGEGTQTTGTGKSGTWDAKTDFDEHYMTDCKIRVTADDGQAENNTGSGESSAFALDTKDPIGYGNSSPADEASEVSINPELTCLTSSDDSLPVSYYFQLAEDDAFTLDLQESGWQSSTSWSPSTLIYGEQYFWRVKAKDSYDNETDYGTSFGFTTLPPGLLRVETSPAVATTIFVGGIPRNDWGLDWVKMPPAEYILSFTDVSGYLTPVEVEVTFYPPEGDPVTHTQPLSQPIVVDSGGTTRVVASFIPLGNLRVETSPVLPTANTIFVDGNPMNDWGLWVNLEAGEYTVSFQNMDGYQTPPPIVVTVTPGVTTHVTGDYVNGETTVSP